MADDDEDMAWRDAVPMPSADSFRRWTLADYAQQQVAMLNQYGTQQMSLQQQAAMQNHYGAHQMYLEQGGMFSHGANWSAASQVCGSALNPAYSANAGWCTSGTAVYAAPSPPIEDAGIRAGEVTGYRVWWIGGRGTTLHSMVNANEWPPDGIMRGNPDIGRLGVHAFKTPEGVRSQYWDVSIGTVAFGRVALWGVIVEHEDGYRAQFARVTAIDEVRGVHLPWRLRRLRRHYGLTGNE